MRALLFTVLLLLAGCGGLPQPFFGNPGREGALLSTPPPARLAVLRPAQSLLTDAGSEAWAKATAKALADVALPASYGPASQGDWRLVLSATLSGQQVIPAYEVVDPAGTSQGTAQGTPVSAVAWSNDGEPILQAAAAQAAPAIDALLTRIQAARLHADPNSLQNRPARVYVAGVSGAPGDGDKSLDDQIKLKLGKYGITVQDTATGADYRVRCEVHTSPGSGGQLKVELQWIVDDSRGERGRVVQLNEVPGGSLSRYWGDVAVVAAEQAADGIKDVLFNAAGPRVGPEAASAKAAPKP